MQEHSCRIWKRVRSTIHAGPVRGAYSRLYAASGFYDSCAVTAMDFFSQTYIALRGPTGAPQTAVDAISRLSDRLSPATLLSDRRAAVLSLKGLSRDARADVGERCLLGLLEVLQNDAEVDADIGKAVLDTLNILCEVNEDSTAQSKELSFKHIDVVLADDKTAHKLFALLGDHSFYLRLAILQFLITLLQNRRQVVQGYFLKAPVGPTTVIATLDEKREIIRTGVLLFFVVFLYILDMSCYMSSFTFPALACLHKTYISHSVHRSTHYDSVAPLAKPGHSKGACL
jgi:hypothetical protein